MRLPKLSVSYVRLCSLLLTARFRFVVQETKMNSDVLTPINDWLRTWRSFRCLSELCPTCSAYCASSVPCREFANLAAAQISQTRSTFALRGRHHTGLHDWSL